MNHDEILIARFILCFCSEQLNDDATNFMEQYNVSHTLSLDDISLSMPYIQEIHVVMEEVEDTQTSKKE